jgi:hypothetical protein
MPWLQSKEEFLHNFFFSLAPIQVTQRTLTTFQGPNAHLHHSKLSAKLLLLLLLLLLSSSSSAVSFPMPLGFCLSPMFVTSPTITKSFLVVSGR